MQFSSTGFLDGFWRDIFTMIGIAGFLLTAIGVWLATLQMRRTTSATTAATNAVIAVLNENRQQFNRYVITQSFKLLTEVRMYVNHESFDHASIRLGDSADLLIQVTDEDPAWNDLITRLHSMATSFERVNKDEISFSNSLRGKWQKLDRDFRIKVTEHLGPFPVNSEATNDP